jgi:hypothetical protein
MVRCAYLPENQPSSAADGETRKSAFATPNSRQGGATKARANVVIAANAAMKRRRRLALLTSAAVDVTTMISIIFSAAY